jgi:hypothetical protein
MSIVDQLREYAAQFVDQNLQRQSALEKELTALQTTILQKKTLLDALRLSPQRLLNFPVNIGPDYQCPRCWIMFEKRTALDPIATGTDSEDFFRCRHCDSTFSVSFR